VQFIGGRVHCVDYYEASGQPLATHLSWLRENGYEKAICILPHDGANVNHISAERFIDHIRGAGFRAEVIANQGKGAAMQRVEAARRMFPNVYIDPEHCAGGLEAISAYHEKKDDKRGIGLGPDHDWSSHGSDAFGMIALGKAAFIDAQDYGSSESWTRSEMRTHSSTGY